MSGKYILISFALLISITYAQQNERIELGKLQSGATVFFIRTGQ